jgi:MinD-like ATPase involved in chromosome partitioning or flagellar assembly
VAKIISVHSYRGGTGKSNLTANLAVCLAAPGKRVAVVDTDIQSPGIHMLFGLKDTSEVRTLNDYLWERCRVGETAVQVTPDRIRETEGHIWLVPSSLHGGEIAKVLREGTTSAS